MKVDKMNVLRNAKILFIGPKYFGYENDILIKLKSFGAFVYYIAENIDYINPFYAFINKMPYFIKNIFFKKYFINKIMKLNENDFDYIFLIRGKLISKEVIQYLKNKNVNSKFIMYQWDSIKNVGNIVDLFEYFDRIYTFDYDDYKEYSPKSLKWNFKPLFYSDVFKFDEKTERKHDIDILFVGSYHSDRNVFLKKIKEISSRDNFTFFTHLYVPRLSFIFRKLSSSTYKNLKLSDVQFQLLSRDKLIALVRRTKTIIDYQAYSQNGLTIRTIESLGSKTKLITTNQNIIYYDFYNPDNILIIDKNKTHIDIHESFINNKYIDIDINIYEKYSLSNWIIEIFSL
jgi:hypothetical protein